MLLTYLNNVAEFVSLRYLLFSKEV